MMTSIWRNVLNKYNRKIQEKKEPYRASFEGLDFHNQVYSLIYFPHSYNVWYLEKLFVPVLSIWTSVTPFHHTYHNGSYKDTEIHKIVKIAVENRK